MKTFVQKVSKVCTLTDRIMWDAYAPSKESHSQSVTSCIEFSRKRDRAIRVSEQEARFAFVESLCRENLRYSVEVLLRKYIGLAANPGISSLHRPIYR